MSKGIQKIAFWALAMWGVALAAGGKSSDTGTSQGLNPASGSGATSSQGGAAPTPGTDGKNQALRRKQARAARHADIDKAQQKAMDSVQAAFAGREAAEAAGSSEIVTEKVQSEAKAKNSKK